MIEYLKSVEAEARAYLADAMRQPGERYPPIFATYVAEGIPSALSGVQVDTAITAIAFAIMAERAELARPSTDILNLENARG